MGEVWGREEDTTFLKHFKTFFSGKFYELAKLIGKIFFFNQTCAVFSERARASLPLTLLSHGLTLGVPPPPPISMSSEGIETQICSFNFILRLTLRQATSSGIALSY